MKKIIQILLTMTITLVFATSVSGVCKDVAVQCAKSHKTAAKLAKKVRKSCKMKKGVHKNAEKCKTAVTAWSTSVGATNSACATIATECTPATLTPDLPPSSGF